MTVELTWYRLSEKHPLNLETVLITDTDGNIEIAAYCAKDEIFMNDFHQEWSFDEIDHWTQLPKHPSIPG